MKDLPENPTEADRLATYEAARAYGLSDAEAREEGWPADVWKLVQDELVECRRRDFDDQSWERYIGGVMKRLWDATAAPSRLDHDHPGYHPGCKACWDELESETPIERHSDPARNEALAEYERSIGIDRAVSKP